MITEKTNILLITTDQQHWNTIQALGNNAIKTPNLDRLTREGVSFDRAYVTSPVCSPSRSSIVTGEYPSRHGCWNIGVELDENRTTFGQLLQESGYSTGLFGKAHFKPVLKEGSFEAPPHIHDREFWKNWNGPYSGFEEVAMLHGHADEDSSHGMHYGAWLTEQGINPKKYFGPGGGYREGSWDLPEEYHYTRWTADKTIEFLDKQDNSKPFMAWCSFQDPHNSFLCPEPWNSMYDPEQLPPFIEKVGEMADKPTIHQSILEDRMNELDIEVTVDPGHDTGGLQCLGHTNKKIGYERARKWLASYYGMISLIDYHIGRVLDKIDDLGAAENTMVVFTSDHGDYAGNHGLWLKGPIHYDDILRVPFLVRWKNQFPAGERTRSFISLVDLAPTFLEVAGQEKYYTMQGVSQFNTMKHPDRPSREWCLVENRAEPNFYVKTLVMNKYKLNYYLDRDEGELYDMQADPHEFINLFNAPEYGDIKLKMFMKLVDIYGELEKPIPPRQSFA